METYSSPDLTCSLPIELLYKILGHCPQRTVLRAAGVCCRWRGAATEHDLFYHTTRIECGSGVDTRETIDYLCASMVLSRLAAERNPIGLVLVVRSNKESVRWLLARVAADLARTAQYLRRLELRVISPNALCAILDALRTQPAPILSRLVVGWLDRRDIHPPLAPVEWPADLFQGHAPRLSAVELCSGVVPPPNEVDILQSVTFLVTRHSGQHPLRIATVFPKLHTLHLTMHCLVSRRAPVNLPPTLKELSIYADLKRDPEVLVNDAVIEVVRSLRPGIEKLQCLRIPALKINCTESPTVLCGLVGETALDIRLEERIAGIHGAVRILNVDFSEKEFRQLDDIFVWKHAHWIIHAS
ncbi:hypothetical protein BKA62DRAFT_833722 [Auriculariales sp. MPI-PUGE-AT-0066]|nr:hypothetical protein BKA62DRAFT_833722 [Auriculariales sp. MPI-PUGE-AT-0066]